MLSPAFARSVSAFGHTYILDFTTVVLSGGLFVLLLLIAVLGVRTLYPHADRQNLLRSLGWGSVLSVWLLGKFYYLGLPVDRFSLPSHVYHLFRTQITLALLGYGVVTWLTISTMVGFLLVIPSELRKEPLFKQAEALWKRAYWLLALLVLLGISTLAGVDALSGIGKIDCVPSFELPAHHPVQVGNPFRVRPLTGRYVGAFYNHWFGPATPAMAGDKEFSRDWSYPGQPFIAQKVGQNRLTLRMQHTGKAPFFIETPFQVEAEEELGNPAFPLQVGNEWRYRSAVTATEEEFAQQFQNSLTRTDQAVTNTESSVNPLPEVRIRVESAEVYDGVRWFTLSVYSPQAGKEKDRLKTFSATMWSGQTYLEGRDNERQPILEKLGLPNSDSPSGERPYPCILKILPRFGTCLCNEAAIDERRKLPGLMRCWQNKSSTTDWYTLPLILLTGGLSLASPALRPTPDREYTVGVWVESSGVAPAAPAR